MHIPKQQLKQDTASILVGKEWEMLLPSFMDDEVLVDPVKTRSTLRQAQQIIREQEGRIRQLEKLALTDELTGLVNRRGFADAFERELSLAQRGTTLGGILVMVDLDGFKGINDKWGHQAGDAYLRTVGHTLKKSLRSSDIVARLGGDEFGILITNIEEENGAQRVAKLERDFNSSFMSQHEFLPQNLALRASFGSAAYTGEDSAETVIRSADLRLYAHKARNKKLTAIDL